MDPIKMVVQLYRITSTRDGGGRLLLDFGKESLDSIQKLQILNAQGDINLAAVFVPYEEPGSPFSSFTSRHKNNRKANV